MAVAEGTLNAFLDYGCTRASVVNPSVDIAIDTCLITSGAYGIAVKILPPCSTGTATIAVYDDKSCANAIETSSYIDNCYVDDSGSRVNAIAFVCPEVAGGTLLTSTTTATFGSSRTPIASGAPASKGQSLPISPSSNNVFPTSSATIPDTSRSTASSATVSDTSRSTASSDTSNTAAGTDKTGSSSGLTQKEQIAIGIAVPVAALLVAILAWQCPKRIRHHNQPEQHNMEQQRPPMPQQPNSGINVHVFNSQMQPDNRNYGIHGDGYLNHGSGSLQSFSPGARRY
ncbi:MAG: hypothetical protein LQ346_008387 [Caloplaca aetnensis]|nr:MAG: hypothetical protein LQ346_008387 [Caloplaca aetnensis]